MWQSLQHIIKNIFPNTFADISTFSFSVHMQTVHCEVETHHCYCSWIWGNWHFRSGAQTSEICTLYIDMRSNIMFRQRHCVFNYFPMFEIWRFKICDKTFIFRVLVLSTKISLVALIYIRDRDLFGPIYKKQNSAISQLKSQYKQ